MDFEKYANAFSTQAISLGSGEALECPNNKEGVWGPTRGEGGFVCSDNERRSIQNKTARKRNRLKLTVHENVFTMPRQG